MNCFVQLAPIQAVECLDELYELSATNNCSNGSNAQYRLDLSKNTYMRSPGTARMFGLLSC